MVPRANVRLGVRVVKHFLDPGLIARNAKTVSLDSSIVSEFADPQLLPGKLATIDPDSDRWNSDIEWISAADEEAFATFQSAFDRLGIAEQVAEYLDLDRAVRLYAGYLVVRSRCTGSYFHADWRGLNNEAFTLLTPTAPSSASFGLLYEKLTGDVGEYDYRFGEGILFGDDFVHSTKPGESSEPVVLLCFQFGTDKMEYWDRIYGCIGRQVTHVRRPDGRFVRTERAPTRALS